MGMQKEDIFEGLEEFSPEQLKQVDGIITSHKGKPGALIPVLEQVQEVLTPEQKVKFEALERVRRDYLRLKFGPATNSP